MCKFFLTYCTFQSKTNHTHSNTGNEVLAGLYRKKSLEKGIKEAVIAIKQASLTWEANYLKSHKNPEGRRKSEALVRTIEHSVALASFPYYVG